MAVKELRPGQWHSTNSNGIYPSKDLANFHDLRCSPSFANPVQPTVEEAIAGAEILRTQRKTKRDDGMDGII